MHIFYDSLRTDHTKIRCNVVDELVESGRAICSSNMKVSLMRGDLVPNAGHQPKNAIRHGVSSHYPNPARTAVADGLRRRANEERMPPRGRQS